MKTTSKGLDSAQLFLCIALIAFGSALVCISFTPRATTALWVGKSTHQRLAFDSACATNRASSDRTVMRAHSLSWS